MRARGNFLVESLAGLVLAFLLWEAGVRLFRVPPFILPAPSDVIVEAVSTANILAHHTLVTLVGTCISLVIGAALGMLVGLIIGYSQTLSRLFYPLLGGFHALPMSAFIPIFVVWFGIGVVPKIVAGILIAFFPVVVNVVTGLRTIEPDLWDMLKTLGATKRQIFLKVGIPRTLPYFFGSLKVAITLAFVGAVISESVASNVGIGNLMLQAQAQFQVPLIFAGLLALAVEGIVMYALMAMLEARMTGWAQRSGFAQG